MHEHQRDAAVALMVALHDFGDRVAVYGFRSQGRTAVHVVPVKRFGEAVDELVMHRMGGLVPGGYTRLGAAIRHGAAILDERRRYARGACSSWSPTASPMTTAMKARTVRRTRGARWRRRDGAAPAACA